MKKLFLLAGLFFLAAVPLVSSQEQPQGVYTNSVVFHTDPSLVGGYEDLLANLRTSTSSGASAGAQEPSQSASAVRDTPLYQSVMASSGFVTCAQNSLKDKDLGRQIDQTISMKASGKVDACLLCGLIRQESGFNPRAGSSAGAQGLTQLMPGTAASACNLRGEDVYSIERNIDCGARYLSGRIMDFDGDTELGLAAYNCGPGCVRSLLKRGNSFDAIKSSLPAETRNYVPAVLANARRFRDRGQC